MDFVEILDDGYTFYQFGAIGQYESRYSCVGIDLFILFGALFSFQEVDVDIFCLYAFEVEGDPCSPGGGALGEGV